MTLITFTDGKPVMRDGKVGTEQECCCGQCNPDCLVITAIEDAATGGTVCANAGQAFFDGVTAEYNRQVELFQAIKANLEAIGWAVTFSNTSNITQSSVPCHGVGCQNDECTLVVGTWTLSISATCDCCISVPALDLLNCQFGISSTLVPCEIFGQPDGVWVNVFPRAVVEMGSSPVLPFLQLGPTCARWAPMFAPYGVNEDYGDDPDNASAIWVPACGDSDWCQNPLP